ncbi:MAG: GspE/PulE/PilB domain-containing protein, partial [Solirubrobacteraceae bacterium]
MASAPAFAAAIDPGRPQRTRTEAAAVSARDQKPSQRLRAVPDPDEEPQVVRAPPDTSSGDDAGDESPPGGRRTRAPAERAAPRAPAEGGAVRAPPDRGKRAPATKQPARSAPTRREPAVDTDAPREVRMPDDDEPRRSTGAQERPNRTGGAGRPAERVAPREDAPRAQPGDSRPAERRPAAQAPAEPEAPESPVRPTTEPVISFETGPGGTARAREVEIEIEPEPEPEPELEVEPDPEPEPEPIDNAQVEVKTERGGDGGAAASSAAGHGAQERVKIGSDTVEFPESARTWSGVTPPTHRGSSSRFLTDVIVEMGFVPRETMDSAIETGRNTGTAPERVLVENGTLSADGLARALAERYGLDHIDLSSFPVDPSAVSLVTSQAAKRYQAVPVAFVDESRSLLVAMADPSNVLAVDDIAIMTGNEVR